MASEISELVLNRNEAKPATRSRSGWLAPLLGAVLGAGATGGIGYLFGNAAGQLAKGSSVWIVVPGLLLCCFLALALHELGHLLAGVAVGFTVHLYVVGPLRVERTPTGGYRVCWNRDFSLYGGVCAALPEDEHELKRRFAFVLLGGPLMSLVMGILVLLLVVPLSMSFAAGSAFLLLLGVMSLLIALMTTLPMPNGAFLTDGARWLRLRRGGPLAERDMALLHLYALLTAGKPVAQWPQSTLDAALTVQDNSVFESTAHQFAYMVAIERGEIEAAAEHLKRCLETATRLSGAMQAPNWMEAAWFAAWHQHDVETARVCLERAGTHATDVGRWERLRTEAAIALRSGQIEEGKRLLAEAGAKLPQSPVFDWSRARLAEMRTEMDAETV